MNLDAINRDPVLHRTPLGRLSVVDYGGAIHVVADDGRSRPRIIHVVERGTSVFDCLYGKNALVQRETRERYAARDAEKARRFETQKVEENDRLERRLTRIFARYGDEARDHARRLMGVPA